MNPVFERIINEITDIDTRRLARLLSYHVGKENRVPKAQAQIYLYGKANDTTARKLRLIVADLIIKHRYPVCTVSKVDGLWLAANHDEAIESAQDSESRAQESIDRARALRTIDLPAVLPEERARQAQMNLL